MGWTKHSSGNRYDSLSSLMFFCELPYPQNIVFCPYQQRLQRLLSCRGKKGEKSPDHECPRNYRGSAKAMESDGALHLIQKILKELATEIYVEAIVADDDSSMRAVLSHQSSNKKGNTSRLYSGTDLARVPNSKGEDCGKSNSMSYQSTKH